MMASIEKTEDVNSEDMKLLVEALKDNKATSSQEMLKISQKLDLLPAQFDSVRREQRDSIDALRREFGNRTEELRRELLNYFVPRSEYDPRHKIVLDKIAEYDKMIAEGRQEQVKYYGLLKDVETIKNDIAEIRSKGGTVFNRTAMIITMLSSILAIAVSLASHINVHP